MAHTQVIFVINSYRENYLQLNGLQFASLDASLEASHFEKHVLHHEFLLLIPELLMMMTQSSELSTSAVTIR